MAVSYDAAASCCRTPIRSSQQLHLAHEGHITQGFVTYGRNTSNP